MSYYIAKVLVSALLIVLISEAASRSTLLGALLASLPVLSILAMIWLYRETGDVERIAALSRQLFWLVLPSLLLFVALPLLLRAGLGFALSLGLSMGLAALGYWAMLQLLKHFGMHF